MPIHVRFCLPQTAWWLCAKEAATKADDPAKVWELVDLKVRGEKIYAATVSLAIRRQVRVLAIKALDGSGDRA
jgi:cytochrome c oxidase subunit 2